MNLKLIVKALGLLVALLVASGATTYFWASSKTSAAQARRYSPPKLDIGGAVAQASIEQGRYIVNVRNGCIDCHGADLGGKAFIDDPAIGRVVAANLTSSALAQWSDDEIANAIRFGIGRDGRPLLVMPSTEYQYMSRTDIASVIVYLRSAKAVDTKPPESSLGPLGKVLYATGKLPLLPVEKLDLNQKLAEAPIERADAAFGEYLANTSCSGCHGAQFRGGPVPGGPPEWPPAANIRLGGNPGWSLAGFDQAIRQGQSPISKQKLKAPMPVELYANLKELEVQALWAYLSTLK